MRNLRHYAAGAAIGLVAILSGCADRPPTVPSAATLMTEGNGERVAFRPTEYGRVYVTDDTDHRILYQGDVDTGQTVEVSPRNDRIVVDGRTVMDHPLEDNHQYRIFFEPLPTERVVRYKVVEEPVR
jgi:hypothetical protein